MVSDEVPSTDPDSTLVERLLVWKLAAQVDLLSRFDSVESIRESEKFPRKDYRKGLLLSSDIDGQA